MSVWIDTIELYRFSQASDFLKEYISDFVKISAPYLLSPDIILSKGI